MGAVHPFERAAMAGSEGGVDGGREGDGVGGGGGRTGGGGGGGRRGGIVVGG